MPSLPVNIQGSRFVGEDVLLDKHRAVQNDHAERLQAARATRRRAKISTIIPNELIVDDLLRFLNGRAKGGEVLDLGAGRKPYHALYSPHFHHCVALDVDHSPHGLDDVDVVASADNMPFENESFDCVICTEVLEHCRDPLAVLKEIRRVLRPGGTAFVTTPFMLGLHETPYDFYRYTEWALEDLSQRAGLDVLSVEPRGDLLAVALAVLQWPVTKVLAAVPLYRYRNPLVWLTVVAPQLAYLAYWRHGRRPRSWAQSPLGYTTILRRA